MLYTEHSALSQFQMSKIQYFIRCVRYTCGIVCKAIYLFASEYPYGFRFISIDCKFSILSTICPIRTTHFAGAFVHFERCERCCVAGVSAVNLYACVGTSGKDRLQQGDRRRRCERVWGAKWWTSTTWCILCVNMCACVCAQFSVAVYHNLVDEHCSAGMWEDSRK